MARPSAKRTDVKKRRGIGGASIGRLMSLAAFLPIASHVPDYARLVAALVLDERMPNERKVLLGVAAGAAVGAAISGRIATRWLVIVLSVVVAYVAVRMALLALGPA